MALQSQSTHSMPSATLLKVGLSQKRKTPLQMQEPQGVPSHPYRPTFVAAVALDSQQFCPRLDFGKATASGLLEVTTLSQAQKGSSSGKVQSECCRISIGLADLTDRFVDFLMEESEAG